MTDDKVYVYDETSPIEHSERDVLHYHSPPPDTNTYLVQLPDSTPELTTPPQQQAPRSRETTIVNTDNLPDTEEEEKDPLQSYIRKNLSLFRKSLTPDDLEHSMGSPIHDDDSVVVTSHDPREMNTNDNHRETEHNKGDLENKMQTMLATSDHVLPIANYPDNFNQINNVSKTPRGVLRKKKDQRQDTRRPKSQTYEYNNNSNNDRQALFMKDNHKSFNDQHTGLRPPEDVTIYPVQIPNLYSAVPKDQSKNIQNKRMEKNEFTVMPANVDSSKSSPFTHTYLDLDKRPSSRVKVMIMIDSSDDNLRDRQHSKMGKDGKVHKHKKGSVSSDDKSERRKKKKSIFDLEKEDNFGKTRSPTKQDRQQRELQMDAQKRHYKDTDEKTRHDKDKFYSGKSHYRDGGEFHDRNGDVMTKPRVEPTDAKKLYYKDQRLWHEIGDEKSKPPSRDDSLKRKLSPAVELGSKIKDKGYESRKGKKGFPSDVQGLTEEERRVYTKDRPYKKGTPSESFDKYGADGKPRFQNKKDAEDYYRKYSDKHNKSDRYGDDKTQYPYGMFDKSKQPKKRDQEGKRDKDAKSDRYGNDKTQYPYRMYGKDYDKSKQPRNRDQNGKRDKDAKSDRYGDDKTQYPYGMYDKDYDRLKQPQKRDQEGKRDKDAKSGRYGDEKTQYPYGMYDKDYDRLKQPKRRDQERDKPFSTSGRPKEAGGRDDKDPYSDRAYPYYQIPDKSDVDRRKQPRGEQIRTGKDQSKKPDGDKALQYVTVKAPKSATRIVAKKRYHIQIPEHGQPETWFNARFNVTDENNVDMNYEGPVKINNYYSSNKYL